MYHYIKYYTIPLIAALVIVGILLGGHWMWLGFSILCIVVVGGDAVLGEDPSIPEYSYSRLLEVPLHLALPTVLFTPSDPGLGFWKRHSRFPGPRQPPIRGFYIQFYSR